jgi:RNA polymerase sigma factor (sigma-70 family)
MKQAEVEELFRRYGSLVMRRARAIVKDDEEARDVMQDVFVRVVKNIDQFRREASPSSWLYRITTNLCLNRIRDRKRQREKLEAQGTHKQLPEVESPSDRIDVTRTLHQLPSELAEVAIYYHVDGMSQQEISELLGIARRTVSYRLSSFEKKARELFAKGAS